MPEAFKDLTWGKFKVVINIIQERRLNKEPLTDIEWWAYWKVVPLLSSELTMDLAIIIMLDNENWSVQEHSIASSFQEVDKSVKALKDIMERQNYFFSWDIEEIDFETASETVGAVAEFGASQREEDNK